MNTKKIEKNKLLNPKQKLFCELYVCDHECFGNAKKSYMTAYQLDETANDSAERTASRLLRNVEVKKMIDFLLDKQIDPKTVDRELFRVIYQNEDLSAKVAAIKEYNRVKARGADRFEGKVVFSWEK